MHDGIVDKCNHPSHDKMISCGSKGKGEMVRDHMSTQPDLFSNTAINPSGGQAALEYRKEMRVNTPVNTVKPTVVEQIIQQETATRKVSKIMVFYSDNTFDTFVSEKNKKE